MKNRLCLRYLICLILFFGMLTFTASATYANMTGNTVEIISGGSSNLLKSPSIKMGIEFQAPANTTVQNVTILPGAWTSPSALDQNVSTDPNSTVWELSFQTDNYGVPSGLKLANGTYQDPRNYTWKTIELNQTVPVTEGVTYWVVVNYQSGNVPNRTAYYTGIYASQPLSDPFHQLGEVHFARNYTKDDDLNSVYHTGVKYFNGAAWVDDPYGRKLPCFFVCFTNGDSYGQPYKHNYGSATGKRVIGQSIILNSTKTVNHLSVPWCVIHPNNQIVLPADDLTYVIRDDNITGTVLDSGVFLNTSEVYVSGLNNGERDRRWYNKSLHNNLELLAGHKYILYFTSYNSNGTAYWNTDIGKAADLFDNPSNAAYANILNGTTFAGTNSYAIKTYNNFSTGVSKDYQRDMAYLLYYAPV